MHQAACFAVRRVKSSESHNATRCDVTAPTSAWKRLYRTSFLQLNLHVRRVNYLWIHFYSSAYQLNVCKFFCVCLLYLIPSLSSRKLKFFLAWAMWPHSNHIWVSVCSFFNAQQSDHTYCLVTLHIKTNHVFSLILSIGCDYPDNVGIKSMIFGRSESIPVCCACLIELIKSLPLYGVTSLVCVCGVVCWCTFSLRSTTAWWDVLCDIHLSLEYQFSSWNL